MGPGFAGIMHGVAGTVMGAAGAAFHSTMDQRSRRKRRAAQHDEAALEEEEEADHECYQTDDEFQDCRGCVTSSEVHDRYDVQAALLPGNVQGGMPYDHRMYGRSKFVMSEEDLNALKHQLSDPSLRETAINSIRGHVLDLSMHEQGCRVIQHALESVPREIGVDLVTSELRGHIQELVYSK